MGLKTASQNAKFQYEAKGKVPLVFRPRSPDFVLQLGFCSKWLRINFGLKPLKPGGLPPENVFSALFGSF